MKLLLTLGLSFAAALGYQLLVYFSLGIPVLIVTAVMAFAVLSRSLSTTDLRLSPTFTRTFAWVVGTLGVFVAGLGVQNAFLSWPTFRMAADELSRRFSAFDSVTLAFAILIAGPVSEEIVFRRFLRSAVLNLGVPSLRLAATTLAFALAHHPAQMPWAFLGGLWLGVVAEREAALVWPILIHAFLNFLTLVVLPLLPHFPPGALGWVFSLTAVALGVFAAFFFLPSTSSRIFHKTKLES